MGHDIYSLEVPMTMTHKKLMKKKRKNKKNYRIEIPGFVSWWEKVVEH